MSYSNQIWLRQYQQGHQYRWSFPKKANQERSRVPYPSWPGLFFVLSLYPSPSCFFHYHTSIGSAGFRWHLSPVAVTTFIYTRLAFHTSGQHGFEHWSHRTAPWTCWTEGVNMNVGPCWCQNQLERATEYPHVHAHLNSFTSNSCFFLMIWMPLSEYHKKQSSSLLNKSTQKLRETCNCQHRSLQHALGRHPRRDPATARLGMVLRLVCLLFPWQSERLMQC